MLNLHFDKFGEADEKLIILHGLFGAASNFRGLARQYAENYTVYCLDLRNHGASFHDDDISYDAMTSDVIRFMDSQNITKAHVMGHSMGGKLAMQLAMNHPEYIDKLIIGDIAPVAYPPNHMDVFDGLNAVNLNDLTSRGQAERILRDFIDDAGVRLFLLTNLVRDEGKGFKWRINIAALESNYDDISAAPKGPIYHGKTLFIRGELSPYIPDAFIPKIAALFPQYILETIEGTGHWLHAEKPKEYSKLVLDFLRN